MKSNTAYHDMDYQDDPIYPELHCAQGSWFSGTPSPKPMGRASYQPRKLAILDFRVISVIKEQPVRRPIPIWASALLASPCMVTGNGRTLAIQWECEGSQVIYTNRGKGTERIDPLDVTLAGGQTLAVSWIPGETAYTLKVFGRFECCA